MCFAPWINFFRRNPTEIERFEVSVFARGERSLQAKRFKKSRVPQGLYYIYKHWYQPYFHLWVCKQIQWNSWKTSWGVPGHHSERVKTETSKRSISVGFRRKKLIQGAKHIYISVTFQFCYFCWPLGNICWLNRRQKLAKNVKKRIFLHHTHDFEEDLVNICWLFGPQMLPSSKVHDS